MVILKLWVVLVLMVFVVSCKDRKKPSSLVENEIVKGKPSMSQIKKKLESEGFQTFDYIDGKTKETILMQQYFIAFLKKGSVRSES